MTPLVILALLLAGISLPALPWFLRRQRSRLAVRDTAKARRRAARLLGLRPAGPEADRGEVDGLPVVLENVASANGSRTALRIRVACPAPFTFSVRPPGPGEVFTGDPQLSGFSFAGSPAAILAALSPAVRAALASLAKGGIWLASDELHADHRGPLTREAIAASTRQLAGLAGMLLSEGKGEQLSALAERAAGDPLPSVRLAALLASAGLDTTLSCTCLEDPDPAVRAAAALFLMHLGGKALDTARADLSIEPALLSLLLLESAGAYDQVREFAIRALGELGSPAAAAALAGLSGSLPARRRLQERFPGAHGAISLSEEGSAGALSITREPGAVSLTKR